MSAPAENDRSCWLPWTLKGFVLVQQAEFSVQIKMLLLVKHFKVSRNTVAWQLLLLFHFIIIIFPEASSVMRYTESRNPSGHSEGRQLLPAVGWSWRLPQGWWVSAPQPGPIPVPKPGAGQLQAQASGLPLGTGTGWGWARMRVFEALGNWRQALPPCWAVAAVGTDSPWGPGFWAGYGEAQGHSGLAVGAPHEPGPREAIFTNDYTHFYFWVSKSFIYLFIFPILWWYSLRNKTCPSFGNCYYSSNLWY